MNFIELQKDRAKRFTWLFLSLVARPFIKVKKNRIFFYSYNFNKYACNPRVFTEYLLNTHTDEYELVWALSDKVDRSCIDKRVRVVRLYSWEYVKALYSSKFIINNMRNDFLRTFFIKKHTQKYIMMWHGSFPLKKIEKDGNLGSKYVYMAKLDSKMCDLMLSNSQMFTNRIRNSFWYRGYILEAGIPRDDVFFNTNFLNQCKTNIRKELGFSSDSVLVLYAPTFREPFNGFDCYRIDWDLIIPSIEKKFGKNVEVLLRLHPNLVDKPDIDTLLTNTKVHDITQRPDITEYLIACDLMISDYTSAMFDFSILKKPCFIYAIDKDEYSRGYYYDFDQLPFSLATSSQELMENIINYDKARYLAKLDDFDKQIWGLSENGHSCESIYNWINEQ